ncbi:hypothetical protein Fcan01_15889 [Folsomia candida]|uniref:Uncharacterized protein n=1 Tax=Folsomia candida TaxID=158441 RepID=A0A226DYX6_FOLCA|nr:hypothetical protein Fcan01_15889 [Folsomia candida]
MKDFYQFEPIRNQSYHNSPFIFENTSFIRRRQEDAFYWANIFPDIESNFYPLNFLHSIFPKIWGSSRPVYFIWIANPQHKIEPQLNTIYQRMLNTNINLFGNREFCLFEDGKDKKIHHLNRYYRQKGVQNPNSLPTELIEKFSEFTEIPCLEGECFSSLDANADLIATTFNK